MNRPRVIFVNRVFTPNESATAQLLHDLSTALAALGRSVTVIAVREPGMIPRDRIQGVKVIRVLPYLARGRGLWSRAFHDAGCWLTLVRAVAREIEAGDTVVAMTDPPLLGLGVAWVATRRARVYHWCQDIYPEVAMGAAGDGAVRRLLGLLRRMRDWSWRRGVGCVVLGEDMRRLLQQRAAGEVRIITSPNWPPLGTRPVSGSYVRADWALEQRFIVAYSGNLGRVHALRPLLEVAEKLQQNERVAFVLVGDGAQRRSLSRVAEDRKLRNVRFQPPQPRVRLSEVLGAGDLHVVALRPECLGSVWPSKFYGIVAAHRPLLFIGPPEAEVSQLILAHGLGGSFVPEDTEGIAAFIERVAAEPQYQATLRERVAAFGRTLPGLAGAIDTWLQLLADGGPPCGEAEPSR